MSWLEPLGDGGKSPAKALFDGQQAFRLQMGMFSPLWLLFIGAAGAGAAAWSLSRWTRLAAPEALTRNVVKLRLVKPEPAPIPVIAPEPEPEPEPERVVAPAPVIAAIETAERAIEPEIETAQIMPAIAPTLAAPDPITPEPVAPKAKAAAPKPASVEPAAAPPPKTVEFKAPDALKTAPAKRAVKATAKAKTPPKA